MKTRKSPAKGRGNTRKGKGVVRRYYYLAQHTGQVYMNWPGRHIKCKFRARAVAVLMFRKWFGREPSESWQYFGMGYAADNRGNVMEVNQINWVPLAPFLQLLDEQGPYIEPSRQIAWKEAA